MHWSQVFIVTLSACQSAAALRAPEAAKPSCTPLVISPSPDQSLNSTGLRSETLESPSSLTSVRFVAPGPAERIDLADPRSYEVRFAAEHLEADALGVDLALDSGRPRRLASGAASLTLGQLSSAGTALPAGEHWLFAAAVSASGLVPRAAAGRARAAVARRFFIGTNGDGAAASGVVWLRKPEGTYNGASSDRVLFDAFAFDGAGALLDAPCTIAVRAGGVAGELRLPAPFVIHDVKSGDYDLSVSALALGAVATRFTVNRELSGAP